MGSVGERIKTLRECLNMTQEELGKKIGVTGVTIMRYEKGQRKINVNALEKIAQVLNVEALYLLSGKTDAEWKDKMNVEVATSIQQEKEYWESVLLTEPLLKLNALLDLLNPSGQQVAVERVEELTEIPKYQKDPPPEDSGNG